jgi:hypothetical protein
MWIGFFWLSVGSVAGCCEQGKEQSDSIKVGEFSGQPNALFSSLRTLFDGVSYIPHNFYTDAI